MYRMRAQQINAKLVRHLIINLGLKLHSSPNKDSCNGAHFSTKKLNAPIVILLLVNNIAPKSHIIMQTLLCVCADPWPLGRQSCSGCLGSDAPAC